MTDMSQQERCPRSGPRLPATTTGLSLLHSALTQYRAGSPAAAECDCGQAGERADPTSGGGYVRVHGIVERLHPDDASPVASSPGRLQMLSVTPWAAAAAAQGALPRARTHPQIRWMMAQLGG